MPSYRGYRFPSEVISHAVWLYHRFSLSVRDVEDLLAERGINVTYETIRQWCLTFGLEYARRLRRRCRGDGLDLLKPFLPGFESALEDPDVSEIMINGPGNVWLATHRTCSPAWPRLPVTGDPRELSRLLRAEQPRLVLLDLMLPGTNGIQLMQTVPELADLPVIFISGYGRDETIARALEAGADDYFVKPFSPTELTARIRAVLRRRAAPVPFALGALAIDYDQRRVTVAGRPVELTATEYELLRVLAQDAGRVLTHETLLRRVWAGRPDVDPKIVRAYVKRLRDKLADEADRPALIINERGVGYRMARPGDP